jgi:hypothetical protein
MDGGETGAGVGGGVGSGGGVGDGGGVGAGEGGAGEEGAVVFTLPPTLEQPDTNSAGKVKSVRRCKILAQKGRDFGSRGQGCLINKKNHPEVFTPRKCTQETKARQTAPM